MANGFVLIPQSVYENSFVGVTQRNTEENSIEPVQQEKVKLLDSSSQFKSKLLPFITPQPPPPKPQQQQQRPSSPTVIEHPQVEDIIAGQPLKEVHIQRIKVLLDKFFKNNRLSLSANGSDTILLDGVDTNIELGAFLYKLQTSAKLTRLETDIRNILRVREHQQRSSAKRDTPSKAQTEWLTIH